MLRAITSVAHATLGKAVALTIASIPLFACDRDSTPADRVPDVVQWTGSATRPSTQPDGSTIVTATLRANIDSGWKFYSLGQRGIGPLPMVVHADSSAGYEISDVKGPAPAIATDPIFGDETETYSGTPEFAVAIRIPKGQPVPEQLSLDIRTQACSDSICLPPRSERITIRYSN